MEIEKITRLEERMDMMIDKVDSLATSVSGLLKYQIEQEKIEQYRQENSGKSYKNVGIVISICAVAISFAGFIMKNS